MMKPIFYIGILLFCIAASWFLLRYGVKDSKRKCSRSESRIGNHGLILYHLFYWIATILISFFVFLVFNAARLILTTAIYFGAGRERELYLTAVYNTIPMAGISLVFLVLFLYILLALGIFSQTKTGRQALAESSGVFLWILEHCFSFLLMLFQLFPMLFGLKYGRSKRNPEINDDKASHKVQTTGSVREYQFTETIPDTYAVFLRRLARFRTVDERIGFSYRTICRLYKRTAETLQPSDTPREIVNKVSRTARQSIEDMDSVRQIIEKVKFSNDAIDETEKENLLMELCRNVRILL